jgi:hypothetical protein
MIYNIIVYLNGLTVPLNFISHTLIFIGSFYVAMHNRKLPQWHITPLWYLGLANFFVAITIIIQWTIGPEHPISYWNMGLAASTLCNIILASIVVIMFVITIGCDIIGRKNRHHTNEH